MQCTWKLSTTRLVKLTVHPLVQFVPLRRNFTGIESIKKFGDYREQCYMLHSRVGTCPFFLSPAFFLEVNASGSRTESNPCQGMGWILLVRPGCLSKVIAPVALMSIVRAEALPLFTFHTLLGVVLPMKCTSWQNNILTGLNYWILSKYFLTGGTHILGIKDELPRANP